MSGGVAFGVVGLTVERSGMLLSGTFLFRVVLSGLVFSCLLLAPRLSQSSHSFDKSDMWKSVRFSRERKIPVSMKILLSASSSWRKKWAAISSMRSSGEAFLSKTSEGTPFTQRASVGGQRFQGIEVSGWVRRLCKASGGNRPSRSTPNSVNTSDELMAIMSGVWKSKKKMMMCAVLIQIILRSDLILWCLQLFFAENEIRDKQQWWCNHHDMSSPFICNHIRNLSWSCASSGRSLDLVSHAILGRYGMVIFYSPNISICCMIFKYMNSKKRCRWYFLHQMWRPMTNWPHSKEVKLLGLSLQRPKLRAMSGVQGNVFNNKSWDWLRPDWRDRLTDWLTDCHY